MHVIASAGSRRVSVPALRWGSRSAPGSPSSGSSRSLGKEGRGRAGDVFTQAVPPPRRRERRRERAGLIGRGGEVGREGRARPRSWGLRGQNWVGRASVREQGVDEGRGGEGCGHRSPGIAAGNRARGVLHPCAFETLALGVGHPSLVFEVPPQGCKLPTPELGSVHMCYSVRVLAPLEERQGLGLDGMVCWEGGSPWRGCYCRRGNASVGLPGSEARGKLGQGVRSL